MKRKKRKKRVISNVNTQNTQELESSGNHHDSKHLREKQKQHQNRNTKKETLYATRCSIYDSNGEVLAQTVDSYNIIAYLDKSRSKNSRTPMHVVDKKKTAEMMVHFCSLPFFTGYTILILPFRFLPFRLPFFRCLLESG